MNLYFYQIDTGKLSDLCNTKEELKKKGCCYLLKNNADFWIFVPTAFSPGKKEVGDISDGTEAINAYLKKLFENKITFKNMYFGIHGADWGISSEDYNVDAFVLEDFNDKVKYKTIISTTQDFVNEMMDTYGAVHCIVKVFSHIGDSSIYNCFNDKFDRFITREKQTDIFSSDKEQNTKDASAPVEKPSFNSSMHKSEPKIYRLEILFFEFRLCLVTLTALYDNEDHDLWKETVGRMIVLLEGGILKRAWTENIIVETDLAEKGYTSLKDNHYTGEMKIYGIGHYVKLYDGEISQIQKCIRLLWNKKTSKDTLIRNLKEVERVIKDVLKAEQKKLEESK